MSKIQMVKGRTTPATQKKPVGDGMLPSTFGAKVAVIYISRDARRRAPRMHLFLHQLASTPARGSEVANPSSARCKMCGWRTFVGRWKRRYDEWSSG